MTKRLLITTIVIGALAQVLSAQTVPDYINYQGRLLNGTNLYSGPVEMAFRLFNTETGGSPQYEESNTVDVVDGLYSTWIGDNSIWGSLGVALNSGTVWVEVVVNGTTLAPRERLQSVAYARYAAGLPADAVKGHMIDDGEIWSSHIMDGEIRSDDLDSGAVTSNKIGDGQIYSRHIHDATITGQDIANFTVSNSHLAFNAVSSSVIGPGEVNNSDLNATAVASNVIDWSKMPAGLQDGDDNSLPNGYAESGAFTPSSVVEGDNCIALGSGGFIAGDYANIGGGLNNSIQTNSLYAVIAGGHSNRIEGSSFNAVIGGGYINLIGYDSDRSVVAGGYNNEINDNSRYSTIGGGLRNDIYDGCMASVIAGGGYNDIESGSTNSVIGGGFNNAIQPGARSATIPGGEDNRAGGFASLAAGFEAEALHDGSFVWSDKQTNGPFASTSSNQFLIRASGGVGIGTNAPVTALDVVGPGNSVLNFHPEALVARFVNESYTEPTEIALGGNQDSSAINFCFTGAVHYSVGYDHISDIFRIFYRPTSETLLYLENDGDARLTADLRVDDNLTVYGDADISGTNTADAYRYNSPQSNSIFFSAADFQNADPSMSYYHLEGDGHLFLDVETVWTGHVGVVCPQGSSIKGITAYYRIITGSAATMATLQRFDYMSTNQWTMASVVSNALSSLGADVQIANDLNVSYSTVNNGVYRYLLTVLFERDSIVDICGFTGVRVDYTMGEVHP